MDPVTGNESIKGRMEVPPCEVIEQDTADNEDIEDIVGFILPPPATQKILSHLTISFCRNIFFGWVRQPSACCAAASIAGSWNSLFHMHRSHRAALDHTTVVDAYVAILLSKVSQQVQSFGRRLGAQPNSLIVNLNNHLLSIGKEIGGKKQSGATKIAILSALKKIAKEYTDMKSENFPPDATMDCILDLYSIDGVAFTSIATDHDGADGKDDESEVHPKAFNIAIR